jgi:hypothetical protein
LSNHLRIVAHWLGTARDFDRKMSLLDGLTMVWGPKKEAPPKEGLPVLCTAEGPPTANRHYLQLVGTNLVGIEPAVEGSDPAVVLPADAHAQSTLPDTEFGSGRF